MLRLSFIIPVFNVEKYISRCLESVFSINLPKEEYEVICIDDCTKDSSLRIIEHYQNKYPNLILLHHPENKRQGGARNTGIARAKGRFIIFVDADDSIPQYDLAGFLAYMETNDLDLLLGAANILLDNGKTKRWGEAPFEESPIMSGPDIFSGEYIHKVAFGVVWMGIYRNDLIKRMRPFAENVPFEDADWTLECAYTANRLQYKPVVIYNYIQHPVSTTRHLSIQSVIDRVRQGLRVWKWSQTVTRNQNAIVVSAKDFCIFNLSVLKSLWKYNGNERRFFYSSFSDEEWEIIRGWFKGKRGTLPFIVNSPRISQFLWTLFSPVLKMAHTIKFTFCK